MFEPNAKIAAKIEAIAEALTSLSPGDTLSYPTLSRLAGERITGGSYVLRRALRRAEESSGAIFDNVQGKGYQRLPTHEIPGIGRKANSRIRRTARRARKRFEGVRTNDLTPKEVAAFAAYRSHFGMLEGIAKEQIVKVIADSVEKSAPVPASKLAASLRKLMGAP